MEKKVPQSEEELLGKLKEQITLLRISADGYDGGVEVEAINLAVRLRVLLHDSNRSKSLLGQLGRKQIHFYDTANDYYADNQVGHWGLTVIRLSTQDGASHIAPLGDVQQSRKLPFTEWWEGKVVVADEHHNTYTRRDLVCHVANTDGGAHVDPELDTAYANLSRKGTFGLKVRRNGIEEDFQNRAVLPSIRQIVHEVLMTLQEEFPDF